MLVHYCQEHVRFLQLKHQVMCLPFSVLFVRFYFVCLEFHNSYELAGSYAADFYFFALVYNYSLFQQFEIRTGFRVLTC